MLRLENISKYYRSETTVTQALRRINLEFKPNEFIVLTGESGSGKSTLLNVLSGLDTYEEGELYVDGDETSYYSKEDWEHYRSQYIGFIFQNYNIIDSYTVYQNVLAALIIQGYDVSKRKQRAHELIDRVGLSKQAHQKSSTLSGGQKQRVSIARALAKDAPIIVADEPTGNLDQETSKAIIQLLKDISTEKLVIMVTHNYESVKSHATRVVRLFDGEVIEDKTIKKVETTKALIPTKQNGGLNLKEQISLSLRNLFSMPKRLMLMLLISILIVFAFSSIYGANVLEESESGVGSYNDYFQNPHPSRLIVINRDQSIITETQLDTLKSLNRVKNIVEFDPVFDSELTTVARAQMHYYFYVAPSEAITTQDLSEGRLPNAPNEIVITSPSWREDTLGMEINLSINGYQYFGFENDEMIEPPHAMYTVVGIVNMSGYNSIAYLTNDFFESAQNQYLSIQGEMQMTLSIDDNAYGTTSQTLIIFDETLEDNAIKVSEEIYNNIRYLATNDGNLDDISESDLADLNVTLGFSHPLIENTSVDITVEGLLSKVPYRTITMNEKTFNTLFIPEIRQITLLVEDAFDANQVLNSLDTDIYHSVYPAAYENPMMQGFQLIFNLLNMGTMIFMFLVLYFITYITLKNIMQSRQKDYVIFRSIGATKKDLYRITIIELITVFIIAFIIVYLFYTLNATQLHWITNYLRYYTFGNYVLMISIMILLAIFTGMRFNKKLFYDSVISALRVE